MTQEIDIEKYHQLALQKQKEHRKVLANLKKKPPKNLDKIGFVFTFPLSLSGIFFSTLLLEFVVSLTTLAELDATDDLLDAFFGLVQAERLTTDKNVTDASRNLFFIFSPQ